MTVVSEEIGTRQVTEPSTIPVNQGGLYRVKEVAVRAVGLRLPSHMAMLPDGRVLVSEFGGGTVRDITAPGGILPASDGRILVADSGSGHVHDITNGGRARAETLLFEGVSNPYGLVELDGRFFTSFSNNEMVGIAEVVPGSRFNDDSLYVWGFPVVVTAEPYRWLMGCGGSWTSIPRAEQVLLAHSALGAIFDVTGGGSYEDFPERRWAWGLNLPLGMTNDPIDDEVYVTERGTGAIKRIGSDGGYARFAQPLVAGFQDPSCIRFTADGRRAFVCDRAVDTVYRVELEHVGA